jgi:glycosyltransferase involved in cell wall biosynthesis
MAVERGTGVPAATEAPVAAAAEHIAGLPPALAAAIRALVACVHGECPGATTVLGGSLASPHVGSGDLPDIDLFVIVPTRLAVLRALRSPGLRGRLAALRLDADAEVVLVWESLVRRGRTSVYGRLLAGDPSLAAAIARSPAPPARNLIAIAHLCLVQSLLDPERGDRLVAKAAVTGFRAWLRRRVVPPEGGWTMATLFSPARVEREAAGVAGLTPEARRLVEAALARLRGENGGWEPARARAGAHAFLAGLELGPPARPLRALVRHLGARRQFGLAPLPIPDPTRRFVAASRALVAAALAPAATRPDPLAGAERLVAQLVGARAAGPREERIRVAARALVAYGRYYPHKILLPAPPPVPPPARAPHLVSFVVPCRNGAATLPAALASVAAQSVPPGYAIETVVVDNGSTDASAETARRLGAIVVREERPGASAARNAGIRRAGGDTLVFLDADARLLGRDFLHHVLRAFALSPAIGLVGAAIECDEAAGPLGRADHMVSFFNWQATQPPGRRHFQPTAVLAARRTVCEETGGFAAEILAFQDFDFCRRVRERGHDLYFEPAARVAHTPRRGLAGVLRHSFAWGWNTRRVYAPYDPARRWRFLDRPALFALNVPGHVLNRVWVVTKRWLWRRPLDTVVLFPALVALLAAWGAGVAAGGYRWIRDERAARRSGMAGNPAGAEAGNPAGAEAGNPAAAEAGSPAATGAACPAELRPRPGRGTPDPARSGRRATGGA